MSYRRAAIAVSVLLLLTGASAASGPPTSMHASDASGPIESIRSPRAVLWDQPLSATNTNAFASQDFETTMDAYDLAIADDFATGPLPWEINAIFVPGNTWNTGCDLTCAVLLHFFIFEDAGGVPAGHPWGGALPVWALSVPPMDPQITLTAGTGGFLSDVSLALSMPVALPPMQTYWLVFVPEMDFTGCCQYGRQPSDTHNLGDAMVINPGGGFGFPTVWTSVTDPSTWGGSLPPLNEFAFRIEGVELAGGASLLGITQNGPTGPGDLWEIDPITGGGFPIGPITGYMGCSGMDVTPFGEVYAVCERVSDGVPVLIEIDPGSGTPFEVGPTGLSYVVTDLSFRNSDGRLFAFDAFSADHTLAWIDLITGTATIVGSTGLSSSGGNGIAFTPNDVLIHSNSSNVHTLDQVTGLATVIGPPVYDPPADDRSRMRAKDFYPGTGLLYTVINDGDSSAPEQYLGVLDGGTLEARIIAPTLDHLSAIAWTPPPPGCPDDAYEPIGDGGTDDTCYGAWFDVGLTQPHLHCDEDWVWFEGFEGATYVIETSNLVGGADTTLALHLGCGAQLAFNDDYNGLASRIEWTATVTGNYDVHIREYGDSYTDGEGYNVRVTCISGCPDIFMDGFESGDTFAWSSVVP